MFVASHEVFCNHCRFVTNHVIRSYVGVMITLNYIWHLVLKAVECEMRLLYVYA